jgi:hypothetical protein
VERTADAALEVRIMLPRGAMYVDTTLPCAWGVVLPLSLLDAFVWTWEPLRANQVVAVRPIAYCQVLEEGALSTVLLAVPVDSSPDRETLKTFEAQMARHLHRHFEIVGWGNEPAVKKLLAVRYNITI